MKNVFSVFFVFQIILYCIASDLAFSSQSQAPKVRVIASGREFDHSHQAWTAFLQKHVKINGHASTIDYKAIKNNPKDLLEYLKLLEALSLDDFNRFSENEKLAFLINAYNAFTVKLIVDHYPVKSIKDIGSLFSSPWKKKFFHLFGEERHLDSIEHDMIRKWFNEPRIHFAVNCASIGCPALRNEAFVSTNLEKQLEEAAVAFLTDKSRNRYSPDAKKLELSSIFKWYGSDFPKKYGSLEAFIAPKITANLEHQNIIRDKKANLSYLDYDWSLNEEK